MKIKHILVAAIAVAMTSANIHASKIDFRGDYLSLHSTFSKSVMIRNKTLVMPVAYSFKQDAPVRAAETESNPKEKVSCALPLMKGAALGAGAGGAMGAWLGHIFVKSKKAWKSAVVGASLGVTLGALNGFGRGTHKANCEHGEGFLTFQNASKQAGAGGTMGAWLAGIFMGAKWKNVLIGAGIGAALGAIYGFGGGTV